MDLDYLLHLLKIDKYTIKNDELWCLCPNPNHSDQHIGSFSINLKTGRAFCFACHFSTDLIGLAEKNNLEYGKLFQLWSALQSEEPSELDYPDFEIDKLTIQTYQQNGLSPYALDRVGDPELLKLFGVYSDKQGNPIFLVQDENKVYKAIWVRENNNYYLLQPFASKSWGAMFGAHLPATDYTIVCEGFFDAIAVYRHLGQRAVCINGTYASEGQLSKLKRMAPLVIMFDGDPAGKLGRTRMFELLGDVESYFCGGYKGDPDKLSREEMLQVFNNKIDWFDYFSKFGGK